MTYKHTAEPSVTASLRVPKRVWDALGERAMEIGVTRNSLVRGILERSTANKPKEVGNA